MEVISSPSPPAGGKNIRRGRREKPWPRAKQRKLLRLYVCTQSERLPLKKILEHLKDGAFDPRQRNTHKHLRSLLPDRRIDDWRPRDAATMLVRVRFLRSVKADRRTRQLRSRYHAHNHNYLRPDFSPGSSSADDSFAGHLLAGPPPGLITDGLPPAATVSQTDSSDTNTPPAVSAGSTTTPESSPREKSPSRSAKSSSSIKSAFKRRSWASVLSSISSGISSLARSSSSASSKGLNLNDHGANMALSKLSREDFLALLDEKPKKNGTVVKVPQTFFRKYSSYTPTHEELNAAVVRMCCSASVGTEPGCVHERLSRAINAQRSEGAAFRDFWVTEAEVNQVDKFGNTLLHVAARWGARVSLLLLILRHTYDVQAVNQRGETFLHVYDPPAHPHLRPMSFLNLVRCLRARGFDFCQRDADKQIFLHRLVAKKEFPISALHCVFREVGYGTARFLVANKAADGERLYQRVCKNLEQQSQKLHRIFGDESEFIRRYLPEFTDSNPGSKASSTREISTPDSGRMSWMHGCPHCDQHQVQTNEGGVNLNESSASLVKRTPVMDLLHKIGSGRDPSEKDIEGRMEKLLIASAKGENQSRDADLNARDTEGNTALHYAAEFGLVPAVKFLCANRAPINVFNNCGNTPLQLVKYAIQRTDVRSDIHMEARYLRCAVLLLEKGAFDQSKFVSERSMIFPYDVFDGSERSIANLAKQGVANQCRGLHLLAASSGHHSHMPMICHHEDGHTHQQYPEEHMSLEFQTSAIL